MAVMGLQLGRILVRLEAPADRAGRARERASLADPGLGPIATLAAQRLLEDTVGLVGVVALERSGLIQDLVGCGGAGRTLDGCHRWQLSQSARPERVYPLSGGRLRV